MIKPLLILLATISLSFAGVASDQEWSPEGIDKLAREADVIFVAKVKKFSERYYIEGKEVPKSKASTRFELVELAIQRKEEIAPAAESEGVTISDVDVHLDIVLMVSKRLKGDRPKNDSFELSWLDSALSMCPHPKTTVARKKEVAIWYKLPAEKEKKSTFRTLNIKYLPVLTKKLENQALHPNSASALPRAASSGED